jgi:hypothetical protein
MAPGPVLAAFQQARLHQVAGAASGVLNAALARQAVASAPAGLASVGSGANNTARYLGAAIGVTIVAVLAGHPTPADVISGWNEAVLVTAAISVAGALTVAVFGPPRLIPVVEQTLAG